MRGRKPKPTALKLLDGNPGKRAINHDEPKLTRGLDAAPGWLDDGATEEWKRVVTDLTDKGVVTRVEQQALACYCQALSVVIACRKSIEERGLTIKTTRGVIANPALKIMREYMIVVRAFASEFGLTPASRSRIHVAPGKKGAGEFKES